MTEMKCYLIPLFFSLIFSDCGVGSGVEPGESSILAEGSITPTASMATARSGHTATLLPRGRVLITGGMSGNGTYWDSTEVYDASAKSFTAAQRMSAGRVGHTATLLRNGKVLVAGGFNGDYLQDAELFDPATGRFTSTGGMAAPRSDQLAVLLNDGRVLLIGGVGAGYTFLSTAEIYDPASGKFTSTGSMSTAREGHTATLLKSGKVLVTGGHKDRREAMTVFSSAELYDPATGKFVMTGDMNIVRHKHAAVLLPDGNVLIAGGSDKRDWRGQYDSAEVYDTSKGVFRAIGNMKAARYKLVSAAAVLKDGKVLIAGGSNRVEVYDPTKNAFSAVAGELDAARFFSSATSLEDGRVLITGGYDDHGAATAKAWMYIP